MAFASAWHDMAQDCEAVILEQSLAPLEKYQAAPFASGKPGKKEMAFYSPTEELVAVARFVGGDIWDQCFVRESEEDEARRHMLAAAWLEELAEVYPSPPYIGVKGLEHVFSDATVANTCSQSAASSVAITSTDLM